MATIFSEFSLASKKFELGPDNHPHQAPSDSKFGQQYQALQQPVVPDLEESNEQDKQVHFADVKLKLGADITNLVADIEFSSEREKVLTELAALLWHVMDSQLPTEINKQDASQVMLFNGLGLDFLAYKELTERLELLSLLEQGVNAQQSLTSSDKESTRSMIASLRTIIEKQQSAMLAGQGAKHPDLERKHYKAELESWFGGLGFDSDMPVMGLTNE
ncbi:hypothetical protein ACSLBF_18725 (plasmid) [Pseudoalteromonas sp. T1lg65]|uniref:hypothetical protein n=1 Tax=Pseudoalteromonas sp. T1lg65 TaxID=2077101 RepID=UPI003F79BED4